MTTSQQAWQRLGFRADVEGLRAIAVLAVLAYHADLPGITGGFVGVDVFFVISGFLITGLLADELWTTRRISLVDFYARRARRLLPAVCLVLVATAIGSAYLLSPLDASIVVWDIVASAFYVANIRFGLQQADYLGGDREDSPVLHLWSLGVEEQFYVIWPLLFVAAGALAMRRAPGAADAERRRALLVWLSVVIGGIGLASLAASLVLTRVSQPWAFFGMPTRAWEFAAGASVALAARRGLFLPGAARGVAAWGGMAVLLAACTLIRAQTPFPGLAALAPALATVALLAAGSVPDGETRRAPLPVSLLSSAPMRFIGRRSYSLYLWHWPAVVLAQVAFGDLHWHQQTLVVLASAVPAILAYSLVENPLHRSARFAGSSRRSLTLGAATTAGAVFAGLGLAVLSPLVRGPQVPVEITPPPGLALRDLPAVYPDRCHLDFASTEPGAACAYGDRDADREIVLFGDSHAAQWFPTIDTLAKRHRLRLLARTKSSCPSAEVVVWHLTLRRRYTECDTWREDMLARIEGESPPALVVVSNLRPSVLLDPDSDDILDDDAAKAAWRAGLERVLRRITRAGVPVLLIRDTPAASQNMSSCVSMNITRPELCDGDRSWIPEPERDVAVGNAIEGVTVADLTEEICLPERCPAVRDGMLVFRDRQHLTATYATALSDAMDLPFAPLVAR